MFSDIQWWPQLPAFALAIALSVTIPAAISCYVADLCGDPTPRMQGRLSLNPLRHVDPLGSVLLPLALFLFKVPLLLAWPKRVPVNYGELKRGRIDVALVEGSTPATTFVLAAVSAAALAALGLEKGDFASTAAVTMLQLNATMTVFYLLPIPPLPCGRILIAILPGRLAYPLAAAEPYLMIGVLVVFLLWPFLGPQLGVAFNPVADFIFPLAESMMRFLLTLFLPA